MAKLPRPQRRDLPMILFGVGLLVFLSPLSDWWASLHAPWYLPFALWAALIACIAWVRWHDSV